MTSLKKKNLKDDNLSNKTLKEYISSRPKLSYEAIMWLFRKKHDRRTDKEIKNLIDSNLAMVYALAIKFHKKHEMISQGNLQIDFMDLFNAGVIGLNQAVEKYDSHRGTKFSTYAYPLISANIRQEIRKNICQLKTYSYVKISTAPLDAPESPTIDDQAVDPYDTICFYDLLNVIESELSEEYYVLFKRFFVEKMSMSQIATLMNKSVSTVQYHISKIKSKLQSVLR